MGDGISLLESCLSNPAMANPRLSLYGVMRATGIVCTLYFSDVSFPSKTLMIYLHHMVLVCVGLNNLTYHE